MDEQHEIWLPISGAVGLRVWLLPKDREKPAVVPRLFLAHHLVCLLGHFLGSVPYAVAYPHYLAGVVALEIGSAACNYWRAPCRSQRTLCAHMHASRDPCAPQHTHLGHSHSSASQHSAGPSSHRRLRGSSTRWS